ncbi:hypothetical protein GCM10023213_08010 [Prosthecobacter algae]|uniref:Abasic site processing protein n=1 Tax=Prosthecobacter algae TaxID=1144682 RepID=A0ABP9NW68_9BACT
MCGRLNQFAKLPALSLAGRALRVERRKASAKEDVRSKAPSVHNLCPTDYADVLTMEESELVATRMRFGLIPSWAKGGKAEVNKKFRLTFNARSETIFELASYRHSVMQRRCLVPVTGWHEWPDRGKPYFIHNADGSPLLLAAIWDVWQSPLAEDQASGPMHTSMSVVTTPPGRYMAKFHDRSPLVLDDERALAWLSPGQAKEELQSFFQPYESELLEAYRVSNASLLPQNKSAESLVPISSPVPQMGDVPVANENETPELGL